MSGQCLRGIGNSSEDAEAFARLVEGLRKMGDRWDNDTEFQLAKALEALEYILSCLGPQLETVLCQDESGVVARNNAAIEQLLALQGALQGLRWGIHHPELKPEINGGNNQLHISEKEAREAIANTVSVIKSANCLKSIAEAARYIADKQVIYYKGKVQDAGQIESMFYRVKKFQQ